MTAKPLDSLIKHAKGVLAKNALWMSFGQISRLAIQAAYFTLIARSLGVSNYGAFAGVVALVAMTCPFAAMGRGNLLIKNVARDPGSFPKMWGRALATTTTFGTVLMGLTLLLSHFILPGEIPLELVGMVALSDVIGLNLITISGQAFQAFEQLHWTAGINMLISAFRLLGALIFCMIRPHPSALQWGYVYLISTLFILATSLCLVSTKLGRPKLSLPESFSEIREGAYFSIGLSAQTLYNDIDKTMLVRLSTLAATGIYGAAYRIIDVSFSPVAALVYAAYPRMFRKGATGVRSGLTFARALAWRSAGYAVFIAIVILAGAGLVPVVLGAQYREAAEALRWLAPLPLLKSIHYFLSDALSGSGHQAMRSAIQVSVAIFNVGINLWLIPRYSWHGAAWSSIASDGLLAVWIAWYAHCLERSQRSPELIPSVVAN